MTDRIPTGFPRLDALLGGGLRAGTLTVIARGEHAAERVATDALCEALDHGSAVLGEEGRYEFVRAETPVDTARLKREAMAEPHVLVIERTPRGAMEIVHDADVSLEIDRGSSAGTVIVTVDKHRGGNVGAVLFTCHAGVLSEIGEAGMLTPAAPSPVAAERARWAEAMADVADGLTRRDQACQRLASTHADDDTAAHERLRG